MLQLPHFGLQLVDQLVVVFCFFNEYLHLCVKVSSNVFHLGFQRVSPGNGSLVLGLDRAEFLIHRVQLFLHLLDLLIAIGLHL